MARREPIFRFDRHCFVPGEYVSITEHDGVHRTFLMVEVVRFRNYPRQAQLLLAPIRGGQR